MEPTSLAVLLGAGGASKEKVYVDDLFNSYVWGGEDSATAINNGIDLAGEGGLVWIKNRLQTYSHWWFDTERGVTKVLSSNLNNSEGTESKGVTAFNSNGFTVGGAGGDCGFNCGGSNQDYIYWTFRKAPGFFDVVTYSGQNNGGTYDTWITIPHNLGSTPGCVMIKCTSNNENWVVWHRSYPTKEGNLSSSGNWNSSNYTGTFGHANGAADANNIYVRAGQFKAGYQGYTYVAYVFAHDDQSFGSSTSEPIIKCGGFNGNGSTGQTISVGFEPQWLMVTSVDGDADQWYIYDMMREFNGIGSNPESRHLRADANFVEGTNDVFATSDGFQLKSADTNKSGAEYMYIAIRRPHKPPEAGTEVFNVTSAQTSSVTTGWPVDTLIARWRDSNSTDTRVINRLTGVEAGRTDGLTYFVRTNLNNPQITGNVVTEDWTNTGFRTGNAYNGSITVFWSFRRAPGFYDMTTYIGNGSGSREIPHNLESKPEMIIIKNISYTNGTNWTVWHKDIYDSTLTLHTSDQWANGGPSSTYGGSGSGTATGASLMSSTSTVLKPGSAFLENGNNESNIALMFATLAGVSKVGSYTGTGNDIDVDCGFDSGARFVLIKRADATGDWYVFDTARGITNGDDPYLLLNSQAGQVNNNSNLDPYSSGFQVTSDAPAGLNASGGTYIYLAIA